LTEALALLIIIIKHMKKTGPEIIAYNPSGVEALKILKASLRQLFKIAVVVIIEK
jgi:hypothetical protein